MQLFLPRYFVLRIVRDLETEAEGKMCVGLMHTPCSFSLFFLLLFFLCSFFLLSFFSPSILRAQNLALQEDDELVLPLLVERLRVLVFAISGL